ncbi:unnamed protein product [Rotaria sordida]|uniref:Uncharacterized protein n=1 Tax=Rotaria sordida TaxID=392033 RepID=A0A815D0K6_9BILA|nr:unnamed protein product [Rotaria sordida]
MYMKVQQSSLVVAFKDLSHFRRQILAHNAIRLLKNSIDAHGLSKEEIATIKLYVSCSFLYLPLNEALRSEQYEQIKPWFPYLKLFHNAIYKLPERAGIHCRLFDIPSLITNWGVLIQNKFWSPGSSETVLIMFR